jgi:acyl-CoA reductase-like NAD-dependent aldehyde dehydrogenase
MKAYDKVYINGKWVAASSQDTIQVFDSTDESVMATIPAGTAKDVDAAAKAAHAAFEDRHEQDAQPTCASWVANQLVQAGVSNR